MLYKKPQITRIKLEPQKAVLACCMVNVSPSKYGYLSATEETCGGVTLCKTAKSLALSDSPS